MATRICSDWEDDWSGYRNGTEEYGRDRHLVNLIFLRPGLTWIVTMSHVSAAILPMGCLFSSAANSLFSDESKLAPILGELNSCVFAYLSKVVNPTLNMNPGDAGKMPFPQRLDSHEGCSEIVGKLIGLAKLDWDSHELSWGFAGLPWVSAYDAQTSIESSWELWRQETIGRIAECKRLEELNNVTFIKAYGLQDELSAEVPEEQVTLTRTPTAKRTASA
jgi:hypothetical protein